MQSDGLDQVLDAALADILALVEHDIGVFIAENASRLIFLQHDAVFVHEDLERRVFGDIERFAQFDGQHDAANRVNFANNTIGFHGAVPLSSKKIWKSRSNIIRHKKCFVK